LLDAASLGLLLRPQTEAGTVTTGLGLAIVKEVADRIGATITLGAKQSTGTSFCVQFAT